MAARLLSAMPLILLVGCHPYPTRHEVDAVLSGLSAHQAETRTEQVKSLLTRLLRTESVADDAVMHYAFLRLSEYYERNGDVSLLDAVDGVPIDGGYAYEACGFYARAISDSKLRARVAPSGNVGIRRCIGLTISEAEVDAIIRR